MVVQLGERRPDIAITGRPQSQAEVDIVERNLQPFLEPANLVIDLTTHQQTCAGDCRQPLGNTRPPAVARIAAWHARITVGRDAVDAQRDAGVLDGVVRVVEPRTERTDSGPARKRDGKGKSVSESV